MEENDNNHKYCFPLIQPKKRLNNIIWQGEVPVSCFLLWNLSSVRTLPDAPGDGIEDIYVTFTIKVLEATFSAVYHDFNSDNDSYNYGSEINLLLTRAFGKHVSAGLKYADYNAARNVTNISRNPALTNDINKFWAFISFQY